MNSTSSSRPWFAHLATVSAVVSMLCEGLFLTTVQQIQSTEAKVFSIIESILDWFFLAGPAFALSLLSFVLCLLFCGLSYLKREQAPRQRAVLLVLCTLQLLVFVAQLE